MAKENIRGKVNGVFKPTSFRNLYVGAVFKFREEKTTSLYRYTGHNGYKSLKDNRSFTKTRGFGAVYLLINEDRGTDYDPEDSKHVFTVTENDIDYTDGAIDGMQVTEVRKSLAELRELLKRYKVHSNNYNWSK